MSTPKLEYPTTEAPNPFDPAALRLSQSFADTVGVKKLLTTVPVRKPNRQDFVRVHPDPAYRLTPAAIIELKEDRETYLVHPAIAQQLPGEFSAVTLNTAINRQGVLGQAAVTKRVQLIHELIPKAATIAYLMNPNHPSGEIEMQAAQTAARSFGREMLVFKASNERELDTALTTMAQQKAGALVVASDPFFFLRRDQLVSLAAGRELPAIYYLPEFVRAGGLMSYGNSVPDLYRVVGVYIGRILKGEKPADLPVIQSSKFEFVINMKTAKALGIEVPNSMQLLADEVIE